MEGKVYKIIGIKNILKITNAKKSNFEKNGLNSPPMEGKVNEIIDTTEMLEEIIKAIRQSF
jgi:hypothetical protein